MSEPLYKWLNADRTSPTQRFQWPEDDALWTPPAKPILCESGWHGMEEKDVLTHLPGVGAVLYEVEVRGEIVRGSDKLSAESMRFKYIIGAATERNLRLFAADCAEDVLPLFLKIRPNDDRPAQALAVARRYANGEATESERAAARAAAWAAAWDAARAAAWAAAGDTAGAAVWNPACAAARDAQARQLRKFYGDPFKRRTK